MKFLDKKEQVLDIQLTPYGEYLFSQGDFKPEYYSFFDDNVLYDGAYASITEVQNSIEPRIQDNTPQLETQIVFSDRNASSISFSDDTRPHVNFFERRNYGLQYQLGTSDILATKTPSYSVSMLRSEISSSATSITGSDMFTQNIPQLNVVMKYDISSKTDPSFLSDSELAIKYPDGRYLDIRPETILAEVKEINSEFLKDNFDIEVFIVEDVKVPGTRRTVEDLFPLKFKKKLSFVQDNILYDRDEISFQESEITPENVEYYFDIFRDSEIDKQLVCSSISELKSKGFYVDTEIECKDVKNISLVDIYGVDGAAPEPCGDQQNPCADKPRTLY